MISGGPPLGHARQCQAQSRIHKRQCRRWALKESKYCQFHGGRSSVARRTNLPRFYSQKLGPTLQRKIEELLGTSHDDQVNVYEELALMRIAAAQAVKLAEPALMGNRVNDNTKRLAISLMGDALSQVREFVVAAAKIERDAHGRVSIHVVNLFVLQVIRAIYRACGDDTATAERIEAEINATVRLPKDGDADPNIVIDGTHLLPSDAAKDMDASLG